MSTIKKKKKFGVSIELQRGFSETINAVENTENKFRNAVVPFTRLELDPENPRKLLIGISEIINGISPNDINKALKEVEFESIRELSHTIESAGLINPIVVYKFNDRYRVVAGERRCLASILLGKTEIEAKVYNEKPNSFDLKLIQWIENTAREDLNLFEKIENIRDMQIEFRKIKQIDLTIKELSSLAGISNPQACNYLAVINGSDNIYELIRTGKIANLDKAALLSNTISSELQNQLIQQCLDGANLKSLRQLSNSVSQTKPNIIRTGRKTTRYSMGHTQHANVIQTIVDTVIQNTKIGLNPKEFEKINWHDPKTAATYFNKMISFLEKNLPRE
jgi:ParB family chromosome partitioning protein